MIRGDHEYQNPVPDPVNAWKVNNPAYNRSGDDPGGNHAPLPGENSVQSGVQQRRALEGTAKMAWLTETDQPCCAAAERCPIKTPTNAKHGPITWPNPTKNKPTAMKNHWFLPSFVLPLSATTMARCTKLPTRIRRKQRRTTTTTAGITENPLAKRRQSGNGIHHHQRNGHGGSIINYGGIVTRSKVPGQWPVQGMWHRIYPAG